MEGEHLFALALGMDKLNITNKQAGQLEWALVHKEPNILDKIESLCILINSLNKFELETVKLLITHTGDTACRRLHRHLQTVDKEVCIWFVVGMQRLYPDNYKEILNLK